MKKIFVNTGICIFCSKSISEVKFEHRPHILPKSMGGDVIGVDVCDDCNRYFGNPDFLIPTPPRFAVEICVKEVMNISRHFLLNQGRQKQRLKSLLFNYFESQRTLVYKQKNWQTKKFQLFFARQFKRGLFEIFLQTYHHKTSNGLDSRFDQIRKFARYNEGDAKLFYIFNRGVYLVGDYMQHPFFPMTDSCIEEIEKYGFYTLNLNGHLFFLEVITQSEENRNAYIKMQYEKYKIGRGIYANVQEVVYIDQIDFTLRTLYGKNP